VESSATRAEREADERNHRAHVILGEIRTHAPAGAYTLPAVASVVETMRAANPADNARRMARAMVRHADARAELGWYAVSLLVTDTGIMEAPRPAPVIHGGARWRLVAAK
jgi:hypothetical protein